MTDCKRTSQSLVLIASVFLSVKLYTIQVDRRNINNYTLLTTLDLHFFWYTRKLFFKLRTSSRCLFVCWTIHCEKFKFTEKNSDNINRRSKNIWRFLSFLKMYEIYIYCPEKTFAQTNDISTIHIFGVFVIKTCMRY